MADYLCSGCGKALQPVDRIRIGSLLGRAKGTQTPLTDPPVVLHPREIFLYHEQDAPAAGYALSAVMTLREALAEGLILD
jgi:hypothetical protein